MANGTDTTVIYMIVVLLALAEQVIAIVAGCAPVVSAWVVRTVLAKESGVSPISPAEAANQPRTITRRMRPDRESREETPQERRVRKWGRGKASDLYPTITTVQSTASEEALDPRSEVGVNGDDVRREETWELGEMGSVSVKGERRGSPVSIV